MAGHGPVSSPGLIDDVQGYLRFVQDLAVRGRAAGVSLLEAARETDLGRYTDLLDAERVVGNLHRAYAELGGLERGAPIDVLAALSDMIAYNGRHPSAAMPERPRVPGWRVNTSPCSPPPSSSGSHSCTATDRSEHACRGGGERRVLVAAPAIGGRVKLAI